MGEKIDLSKLKVEILEEYHDFSSFSCGIPDLDAFIRDDALTQQKKGINVTYVFIYEGVIGAFCTVSSDLIELSKKERKRVGLQEVRYPDYPAMKIGRLAVDDPLQHKQLGKTVLRFAIGRAGVYSEKIGCRFVTVDAYNKVREWYARQGFEYNEAVDEKDETVSMRFDLHGTTSYTKLKETGLI